MNFSKFSIGVKTTLVEFKFTLRNLNNKNDPKIHYGFKHIFLLEMSMIS